MCIYIYIYNNQNSHNAVFQHFSDISYPMFSTTVERNGLQKGTGHAGTEFSLTIGLLAAASACLCHILRRVLGKEHVGCPHWMKKQRASLLPGSNSAASEEYAFCNLR